MAEPVGKSKCGPPPPTTPLEVIRRRRRRLMDRASIVGFFSRLALLVVLVAGVFGLVFGLMPAPNDDMSPSIGAGDLLLFYRLDDHWITGDVVVAEQEGQRYVGRVVARGGDTVEITPQATLVVNGSTVLESDIYYSTPPYESGVTYPITLAQDQLFLLCDYREGARDSRYYGPVNTQEILGKVITVMRRSNL